MRLREVSLKGYKSIDEQTVRFGDVTVLLGANGAGKSNLVDFFTMLHYMTSSRLQEYVGREGVNRLLFYGSKKTEAITFNLVIEDAEACDEYSVRLAYGVPDRLFVGSEVLATPGGLYSFPNIWGGTEIALTLSAGKTNQAVFAVVSGIRTYQFHDTSDTARIKDRCNADDATSLRGDAGNLAAYLRMLKKYPPYAKYYQRIVRHIRQIMPQFGDFELDSIPGNEKYVRLNWRDSSGSDYLLDPDQISDGSLRYMALATLLLQPPERLPKFIVLDEPELGLHPAAITELAGMIRGAAQRAQILLATQSTRLVDEFSLDDVVVVERNPETQASEFKRLDPEPLEEWLKRYSLSELWEKNVLGGQP